jgi:transposase
LGLTCGKLNNPAAVPPAPADLQGDTTIWRVDDDLWCRLAPLLVVDKPRKKPGRPRHDDRRLFNGVIWILRTGAQWQAMPAEFGPKSTVHARFQEWVQTGALARAWRQELAQYDAFVGLDLEWQAADGCLVKAPLGKKGGPARRKRPAPTPPTGARRAPNATC